MEINRSFTALLRMTEVDGLLRQLTHLSRRKVIGFADFPRFLTEEISLKLSTVPSLEPAIDALKGGLSVMMNPMVEIQFPSAQQLQLYLMFVTSNYHHKRSLHFRNTNSNLVPFKRTLFWWNNAAK